MAENKTSTFTIHHDRCHPDKWTARDLIAFADFVRYGAMQEAAQLSRLGMQLVLSEHHTPKGGDIEQIGWAAPTDTDKDGPPDTIFADLADAHNDACGDDVIALTRIYRGPIEYVAAIPMGDGDGNFDGYEYEPRATVAEAMAALPTADDAP